MLRLLKIKVSGYKMLQDDFTLDFVTKARVYEKDKEREIERIDEGLYGFRTIAFVGGNSSGKTTVLSLVSKTLLFLQTGRWKFEPREFRNDHIEFAVTFYLDGKLYDYKAKFLPIPASDLTKGNLYSPIEEIDLRVLPFIKAKGSKNLLDLPLLGTKLDDILSSSFGDTSAIKKITANQVGLDDFIEARSIIAAQSSSFYSCLERSTPALVNSIARLLDESIEYIAFDSSDFVRFKRYGALEERVSKAELLSLLSSGTLRGLELYLRSIEALKYGKTILVDEIENAFQKNLVYNLLFLFNDAKINVSGAQLLFTTHYVEILDYLERRDNINITHKKERNISIANLYSNYTIRTELSKSKQFNNNVFNTSFNYEQLLEVRQALKDELRANHDGGNDRIRLP